MKKLLKFLARNILIATVSTFISFFILLIIFFAIVGSIAQNQETFPSSAVLRVNLTMNLIDTPPTMDLAELIGQFSDEPPLLEVNIHDLIETINRAKTDRRIKALLIEGSFQPMNYGCSYPVLNELRLALEDFKESEKPIIAYSVNPQLRDLYVMSVADEFYLNKRGTIELYGLYAEHVFFANALNKYGIGVQTVRVGDYKSAVEPFTRTQLSPAAKEANQQLLDELWIQILGNLAQSRGLDPIELNKVVDRTPILLAEDALELGLCDEILDHVKLVEKLAEISEAKEDQGGFPSIWLSEYILEKDRFGTMRSGDGIAVVYAEGEIVGGYGRDHQAGAQKIVELLQEAKTSESIKGIVLRVNSPGGGATASKIIQDELLDIKAREIPLVVSMGGYAASGGYLISQSADKIFAQPHTITGSIGIFGLLLHFGEGAGKLGITFDETQTNENGDILSFSKPKTPAQLGMIQVFLDSFYQSWVEEIAEYREKSIEEVKDLAKGRVWSGYQALEVGLVDEMGGLLEAVDYAAELAGMEDYTIYDFPRKLTQDEAFADALGFNTSANLQNVKNPLLTKIENLYRSLKLKLEVFNDPVGAYALSSFQYE